MFLKKIIRKVPVCLTSVILTALITYLSLDGNPFDVNRVRLFEGADKVAHCVMYLSLSAVYIFDCAKILYPKKTGFVSVAFCAYMAFMFSLLMEMLQELMGIGRAGSIGDITANLAGALGGYFFMKYYFLKRFNDIMRS